MNQNKDYKSEICTFVDDMLSDDVVTPTDRHPSCYAPITLDIFFPQLIYLDEIFHRVLH